jgi:hypothetical protein
MKDGVLIYLSNFYLINWLKVNFVALFLFLLGSAEPHPPELAWGVQGCQSDIFLNYSVLNENDLTSEPTVKPLMVYKNAEIE